MYLIWKGNTDKSVVILRNELRQAWSGRDFKFLGE